MRWQLKGPLAVLIGTCLAEVGRFIEARWTSSSLPEILFILAVLLILSGALHFCLNTIAESLRR